jgi:hypothetical protein
MDIDQLQWLEANYGRTPSKRDPKGEKPMCLNFISYIQRHIDKYSGGAKGITRWTVDLEEAQINAKAHIMLSPANLYQFFPKRLVLMLFFHSDFQTFSPAPSSSHHLNPSLNWSSKIFMSSISQKFDKYPKPIPSLNAYLIPLVPSLHSFLPLFSYFR